MANLDQCSARRYLVFSRDPQGGPLPRREAFATFTHALIDFDYGTGKSGHPSTAERIVSAAPCSPARRAARVSARSLPGEPSYARRMCVKMPNVPLL
jgi:hypothetical protein